MFFHWQLSETFLVGDLSPCNNDWTFEIKYSRTDQVKFVEDSL